MRLKLENSSSHYIIKQFTEADIPHIYKLCKENHTYYHYRKIVPTMDNLKEVLTQLPPNKTLDNKYFVGFYKDNQLAAILDLITEYPNFDTAYIGWFMVDKAFQKTGIGTEIMEELFLFLKQGNFSYVELGCIKANKEALKFWLKKGFRPIGAEVDMDDYTIINMRKKLSEK